MTDSDYRRVNDVVDDLFDKHPPQSTELEEFWGAQYDLGLAWVCTKRASVGLVCPARTNPISTGG